MLVVAKSAKLAKLVSHVVFVADIFENKRVPKHFAQCPASVEMELRILFAALAAVMSIASVELTSRLPPLQPDLFSPLWRGNEKPATASIAVVFSEG